MQSTSEEGKVHNIVTCRLKARILEPALSLDNTLAKRLPRNKQQQLGTLHDDRIVTVIKGVHCRVLQEPT
jgi:hypothetical protein